MAYKKSRTWLWTEEQKLFVDFHHFFFYEDRKEALPYFTGSPSYGVARWQIYDFVITRIHDTNALPNDTLSAYHRYHSVEYYEYKNPLFYGLILAKHYAHDVNRSYWFDQIEFKLTNPELVADWKSELFENKLYNEIKGLNVFQRMLPLLMLLTDREE